MIPWYIFFFLTVLCVFLEAFFSMFEMAAVSFNKVRLHYYLSKNHRRARWLSYLLEKPSRLFGTTLICVNTVLQIGSECSRKVYESLGASPDLAPLTQVIIVMIFGELAPLFAARRHSETVAIRSIPIVYGMYWLLTPIIKAIEFVMSLFSQKDKERFLSRDELQKAFADPIEDFNEPIEKIFSIRTKKAKEIFIPLDMIKKVSSTTTMQQLTHLFTVDFQPYILIFHRTEQNIVGVLHARFLLNGDLHKRVIDKTSPPWFITEEAYILDILKQFRTNNQNMAIVLSDVGEAIGVITLDQIIVDLFGKEIEEKKKPKIIVEKTLSGDMTLREFNDTFHAHLTHPAEETLSELLYEILQHHPVKGEIVTVDQFEFTVLEPGIIGAKTLLVRSIQNN